MLKTLILVGFGGGVGSILRYLIGMYLYRHFPAAFPWGTWMVNVLGCFLIGLFVAIFDRSAGLNPEWRQLLVVGFCGGFTTFSAFSLESLSLLQNNQAIAAFLYMGTSIIVGFSATTLGFFLMK